MQAPCVHLRAGEVSRRKSALKARPQCACQSARQPFQAEIRPTAPLEASALAKLMERLDQAAHKNPNEPPRPPPGNIEPRLRGCPSGLL